MNHAKLNVFFFRFVSLLVIPPEFCSDFGFESDIEITDFEITEHTYVYPGFDNLEKKLGMLGRIIRKICYWAEKNWLRRFGLSHFLVLVKTSKRD